MLTGAVMMMVPGMVTAAPLCQTSKGLFTPCTKREVARARQHKVEVVAKKEELAVKERQEEIAHPERPHKAPRKPLFGVGRLCRDTKGLATPCPR